MAHNPRSVLLESHGTGGQGWVSACSVVVSVAVVAMAVLCTNLLALRTRELADLIETLPVSLAPEMHYERCCELLEQLAIALDLLADGR